MSTSRGIRTRGRAAASPLFGSTTSVTAKMPWTPSTATLWTAENCASKWRATVGLPTRTGSRRHATAAQVVGRGRAHAAGAAAGREVAGGQGHADAQGVDPAQGVVGPVLGRVGLEAGLRIAGGPGVDPGGAGAEVGERAAAVADARAGAGTGAEAARGAARQRKADRSPGGAAGPSLVTGADRSIAVAPSQRTAAEADIEASQRNGAEASTAAGQKSAVGASTAAGPGRGSEAGASSEASPRSVVGASSEAGPSRRNAAEARDSASPRSGA